MVFKTKDEVRSLSKILRKLSCWWCGQSENYNRQGRGRKEEKRKEQGWKAGGNLCYYQLLLLLSTLV